MTAEDVSEVALAMALTVLRDIGKRWWHKLDFCTCPNACVDGVPCEIGQEEIEAEKAALLFAEWDALGLGYIGPLTN